MVREPATESSEPYDSHPALNVRLSALHEAPHRPAPDPDPSAIELISDVPGLEGTLFRWMTGVDGLQPIDWDDAIQKVWLPFWEERCRDAREGLAGVTPASLPDQRWDPGTAPPGAGGMPWGPLVGLALTVLLASRGWSIAGAPGDPVTATRDGTVIEMFSIVPRLAAGELTADAWRALCRRGRHRGGRPGRGRRRRGALDSGQPKPSQEDAMPLPDHTTLNWGPWYRKSPFFEATLRAGCSAYDVYQHMYHPNTYGDPVEEYWALVNDVTLWDVSVERIVEITGPDASAFTNLLTCRDLTKCAVKQGKYMLVTAEDGGIVNDPVLLRVEENRWWLALADSDAGLYAMGVAVNSGLDVQVGHPDVYPVQVQGPKAKETMRDLFGDWILDMKYYWCDEADLDGIPVVISRTGWTAVVGYEIYLRDPSRGDDLWERILDAGKPYNIRVTPSSDIRRIEAGIFDWGSDIGLTDNPFEVTGLERLVEDQEADYIGKEALERIRREGVSRKLVGIELEGDPVDQPTQHWPVAHGHETVGHVTDACWSPRLEKNIGYVWVPIELAEPGTRLDVETDDGTRVGTTATLPFIDPNKKVPAA